MVNKGHQQPSSAFWSDTGPDITAEANIPTGKRNSSEAARPVPWTFPTAHLDREGREWIYEVCRHRNGRMKRSSLGPSRKKEISKCTVQPLAGSARGMQDLEAAACGAALSAEH